MTEKRARLLALRLLFAMAVPTVLTLGSVRLLLSYEFLRFEYQRPGFPVDPYGFSVADRLAYGMYAIDYLFNAEPLDFLASIRIRGDGKCAGADACTLFNERELQHMGDVKELLRIAFAVAVTAVALAGVALLTARSPEARQAIRRGLRAGSRFTIGAIILLGVMTLLSWNSAFDAFHELLFPPGSWRFLFSDSLIRLYPERLFVDAAAIIGALSFLGALLIMLGASQWEARSRQRGVKA